VKATTHGRPEIHIRDSGTGILPEMKEKMFNSSSSPSRLA
jgi:hypothetical protein